MTLETLEVVAASMGINSINIHRPVGDWVCIVMGSGCLGNGAGRSLLEALNEAIESYRVHASKKFRETESVRACSHKECRNQATLEEKDDE